jgi:hypothetical protein
MIPNETARQEFLKLIARMETDFERIEATLRDLNPLVIPPPAA